MTLEALNTGVRQALAHWEAGRLDDAARGFAQAIAAVQEAGWPAVADLHAQLAAVRDAQGQLDAAVAESMRALAAECADAAGDEARPSVKVARYFLADRLVRQGQAQAALAVLAPSLAVLPDDWLLNLMQAEALASAGQPGPARAAAERALAHAPSADKRAQLAERLAPLLRD